MRRVFKPQMLKVLAVTSSPPCRMGLPLFLPFLLLPHSLCSGSVLRKLFPFSGTPGSCFIRRACPHRQLSQPAWAEAQPSGLNMSSAAHRRFRGGSSLHLKRYSRKNGYIVFGFHPRPIGRGLPAEKAHLKIRY